MPAVLQIVPCLDSTSGVAAHAMRLAAALDQRAGIVTRFLAPRSGRGGSEMDPGPSARSKAFEDELDGYHAPVLLHYSNYGFDRRGCPRWLVAALERWRCRAVLPRLVVVFHEVYATGLPWQSSFWLSPVQRRLAARLSRLSDHAVTSLEQYRQMLLQWRPEASVVALPVFSTVGEPTQTSRLADRKRRMVIFGSPGLRARAYQEGGRDLAHACALLGIEEIADVGPGAVAPGTVDGIAVSAFKETSDEAVSAILADSVAGFIRYPPDFLAKSTVFAAFSAHRLLPVCSWPQRDEPPACGSPCWHVAEGDLLRPQETADAAHHWYQGHSLSSHVSLYSSLLQ